MTYLRALRTLGLPVGLSPEQAWPHWKAAMVSARRGGDEERARVLSQVREALRSQKRHRCEVCGTPVQRGNKTGRCDVHRRDLCSVRERMVKIEDRP